LIGLDAANLFPAIDDDEVEVYWLALDKINLYRAGAVRVHGIGGTLIDKV
jgi:predicted house-cleaning NTP pyrophosphatase (Maf/HAM1 superfamily)